MTLWLNAKLSSLSSTVTELHAELILTVFKQTNTHTCTIMCINWFILGGCSGIVAEYWTRNRQGAGSTLTWSTASNLEKLANLLCAQANSASYPQRDER